mgnify:CR=1 FL=1
MFVRMLKDYQGCKAEDVVRFQSEAEGRAVVAAEAGEEVVQTNGEWVAVTAPEAAQ